MAPEIYAVLAVIIVAAAAYVLLARRERALPEAEAKKEIRGEERKALRKPEPEPEPEPESEPESESVSDSAAERDRPAFKPPRLEAVPMPVDKPKIDRPDARLTKRRLEQDRYREGLAKTRGGFVARLARVFTGRPKVDAALKDRVEEVLFTADIGTTTAEKLLAKVTEVLDKKEVADADAVWAVIRQASLELLDIEPDAKTIDINVAPYVLLMIGVNGVGKTTTLGKLAARHVAEGRKVLLVAGDTFRAAAVEQLEVWAHRVGCELHRGADKADPSSVIFEGVSRGRREGFDVVLCDTAGRLHTRKELMDELEKVRRSATKAIQKGLPEDDRDAVTGPHDTYLVLDATIGQNALQQAKMFKESMDFTGLVITKLDGTAKGGVVLGICDEMRVPIRYIGIGEGVEDLRTFNAEDFADALFDDRDRVDSAEAAGT
jgi:fused signal recognition particle receptor